MSQICWSVEVKGLVTLFLIKKNGENKIKKIVILKNVLKIINKKYLPFIAEMGLGTIEREIGK